MSTLRIGQSSSTALKRQLVPRIQQLTSRRFKSGPYGYTQAKALVYSKYGEPEDVLSLHSHSISPSLPSNTLLLRTLCAPLNPADINQIQGLYPSKPELTPLLGTPEPSAVAGNEGVFEVLSSPSALSSTFPKNSWAIMRHTNFGTWRTHSIASPSDLIPINKEGLTPIQAGTVGVNPTTAWCLLRQFGHDKSSHPLREGDFFIQNGGNSAVGKMAIQLGAIWGLKSISIIRDRSTPSETEALKQELLDLGATHVATESELLSRSFRDKINTWTNNGRSEIKLALNCVGGKPTQALLRYLGKGAEIVTYGGMSKDPVMVPTGNLIFRDLRFSGFWVSRWGDENMTEKENIVKGVLDLYREGKLKVGGVREVKWNWETEEEVLKKEVQGTLEGRRGKGVWVFGEDT